MFYLAIQTAALLSICAVIFFGIGWMAKRWLDTVNPWRQRELEPRDTAGESMPVAALQANLKQVSDELASRNISLQATKQSLQETERKWVEANVKIATLEKAVEEHLERQEQFDQEKQRLQEALRVAEENAVRAATASENSVKQSVEQAPTPVVIAAPPEEGIAGALREQLKNLEARNEELRDELQRLRDDFQIAQAEKEALKLIIDELNAKQQRRSDPVPQLDIVPLAGDSDIVDEKSDSDVVPLWASEQPVVVPVAMPIAASAASDEEKQAMQVERDQLEEQVKTLESDRDRLEQDKRDWLSRHGDFELEKARFEDEKAEWERGKATFQMEQQALAAERFKLEQDRAELQTQQLALEQQKQASALERRQLDLKEAACNSDRDQWLIKIDEWEKQLAEPAPQPTTQPAPSVELIEIEQLQKALQAERDAFEAEKYSHSADRHDNLEEDLKKRLMVLEETLHNLKADSEMAILAQMEFQARAMENESEERRRWEDLEHELELRITQLEHELRSVRQAEQIVAQLGEQVEEKLKTQLSELAREVSDIKSTWNNQEVEFKHRDEQILGNLDKLQSSLSKLGIRIAEEDSIPDSMLKEMDELRGDILSSVPHVSTGSAAPTEMEVLIAPDTSTISKEDITQLRDRFEQASGNLQQMLEEKDRTIRALDEKLHSMARKLDPALVGQDDLSLIKGIGPYIKRTLEKEFGISSFKQIVMMDKKQLEDISARLFFKGKIQKEDWIAQAIELHFKKYDERLENPQPPYRYHWF